jgi:protocatechuate 3,4-dioxygenase beta subunit
MESDVSQSRRRLLRLLLTGTAGGLLAERAFPLGARDLRLARASAPQDARALCMPDPPETAGPFPSDGTNAAGGQLSDILLDPRIVRSDLRTSFGSSSLQAAGVPLTLTLAVVDATARCRALHGAAVYLWHCDAHGGYSLYGAALQRVNYLRGVQVSGPDGEVTFRTVFPGCYFGRYPHIHLEVYPSLAATARRGTSTLTTQLAMPREVARSIYGQAHDYPGSAEHLAQTSTKSDMVFADSNAAQIALQTPVFSGDSRSGYSARARLAVG